MTTNPLAGNSHLVRDEKRRPVPSVLAGQEKNGSSHHLGRHWRAPPDWTSTGLGWGHGRAAGRCAREAIV
jgi:hypothetical protein